VTVGSRLPGRASPTGEAARSRSPLVRSTLRSRHRLRSFVREAIRELDGEAVDPGVAIRTGSTRRALAARHDRRSCFGPQRGAAVPGRPQVEAFDDRLALLAAIRRAPSETAVDRPGGKDPRTSTDEYWARQRAPALRECSPAVVVRQDAGRDPGTGGGVSARCLMPSRHLRISGKSATSKSSNQTRVLG
jgi:hypothetical protein